MILVWHGWGTINEVFVISWFVFYFYMENPMNAIVKRIASRIEAYKYALVFINNNFQPFCL